MSITILGIESSCDDTSAAIVRDGFLLSNITAGQEVHKNYGGVVPELASRAHQQNIIPVVDAALKKAGIEKNEIDAVAFTRGPGLLGSLLIGASFAKGFALSLNLPLIEVNHLQAHVLANFIKDKNTPAALPSFPFLCLLISGGHTQLLIVKCHLSMESIGTTIDDAAGEAFDKCAKVIGLPYPGGPVIDQLAIQGNPKAFTFTKPAIHALNFSFSGLKTAFLYFIRDRIKTEPDFIEQNKNDICASIQSTIVEILLDKLKLAVKQTGIKEIALAGGVSANSLLKKILTESAKKYKWNLYIPENEYTTDNAAMVAYNGYFKYLAKEFSPMDITPLARYDIL